MTSDFPQLITLFGQAAEFSSPAERAAFLDAACGPDAALRAQVEDLLAAAQEAGSFMEGPAVEMADSSARVQGLEGSGTLIGPYKLLEQIGEGGFGVVYLAEQERPVRRRVALKIIKPGMDTREVIGRFEAERQALAMMDHPCIAKVFDAGMVGPVCRTGPDLPPGPAPSDPARQAGPTGRPYFVMELVQGVPITEYCDECNLSTRERLDLFVAVCQAVQHAHQKGVIHRDLKPTNVLVAMQDGRATPKIIDFGVAKAIGDVPLTERTLTTAFAQMVGTPMYMSPEQAELSPLGVDTRSDIYSLGVLLYELLTGATPFDKERLHAASYDELRRIIREEEPPRPSARISTLAADLATTIAERRRTDARRLRQTIGGELDWIAMKCLEKDRNRRYETASGLARDVERYLHDEPVQACPPSTSYRVKKFIRRNKTVAAFVALLLSGLVGLGLSNVQLMKERDAKTTALARAEAISNLLQQLLASSNPDQTKGSKYTVRELLDDFSAGLGNQLAGQPQVEADIRSVIGKSYWRLGVYDRAELHSKKALHLRRQLFGAGDERVADSLVDYAWNLSDQGRNAEAEKNVRDALAIYQEKNSDPHRTVRALWTLQQFLIRQIRLAEAEEVANEALALAGDGTNSDYAELPNILHGLAGAKSTEGKYEEAEKYARRAVDIHRRLHGDDHPETAWGLLTLGQALRAQQKFAEAEKPLRESLAIFRKYYTSEHSSIQGVGRELESVLRGKDDRAGLDALAIEVASRSGDPGDDVHLAELLLAGRTPTDAQREEAHRRVRQAIEGYARVASDYPGDLDRRWKALEGYTIAIGPCLKAAGLASEVDELNRRLEAELPQLLAAFPGSGDCQWWAAVVYLRWAARLYPYGDSLPTCERALRQSVDILEKLARSDPKRYGVWLELADVYLWLGDVEWRLAGPEKAAPSFRRTMEIYDQHAAEIAAVNEGPITIVWDDIYMAYFLASTGREEEAGELVRKAADAAKLVEVPALSAQALFALALIQPRVGDAAGYRATCQALTDVDFASASDLTKAQSIGAWCVAPDALQDMSLVVKRAEGFAKHNSLGYPYVELCHLGAALFRAREYDRAAELLEQSIDLFPSDPSQGPGQGSINVQRLLLAMTQWRQGRQDEARQVLAKAQAAIDEEFQPPSPIMVIRIHLEVLRREAEELIKPKARDEAVENKGHINDE